MKQSLSQESFLQLNRVCTICQKKFLYPNKLRTESYKKHSINYLEHSHNRSLFEHLGYNKIQFQTDKLQYVWWRTKTKKQFLNFKLKFKFSNFKFKF